MWSGLTIKRRAVQWLSLGILNVNFWGGGNLPACIGVLQCEACALAWLGCPVGMLSGAVAFHEFPFLVLGIVLGAGVLFGRFLCGWVCPFGLLQDLLYKIPLPKLMLPRFMTWFKYGFLFISVVGVAYFFGKTALGFFCNFCPAATLEVFIPAALRNQDYSTQAARILRYSALALFLVLAIVSLRGFCKVICPIGALVAVTNKLSLMRIRLDPEKCVSCKACNRHCPMDIDVMRSAKSLKPVNRNLECIECLKCEDVCPVSAIHNNSRILRGRKRETS